MLKVNIEVTYLFELLQFFLGHDLDLPFKTKALLVKVLISDFLMLMTVWADLTIFIYLIVSTYILF